MYFYQRERIICVKIVNMFRLHVQISRICLIVLRIATIMFIFGLKVQQSLYNEPKIWKTVGSFYMPQVKCCSGAKSDYTEMQKLPGSPFNAVYALKTAWSKITSSFDRSWGIPNSCLHNQRGDSSWGENLLSSSSECHSWRGVTVRSNLTRHLQVI